MVVFTIPGIRGTIRVHNQRTAAWLRRTYRDALRGDAEAQWHIGVQLKSADHPGLLPVDDHAAFKWLVRAARGGATAGWSQVACAYKDGIGVRRDRKKAFALVYASALEGDLASMMNVGRFYRDGIGVKRDVAHGVAILEDVVNRGFTFAAYEVAQAYRRGVGVRKSLATAAHWLRVSALHDHARAAYDLALMHEEGRGVPRTPREAFRFMKLAAEFADWDAYHALGWYYRNGFGCGVDEAKAMMWYRRGARAGNPASAFNLAVNYAEGSKVVRRSMRMARKYWELALRRDPEWTRRRAKRYAALRPLLAAGDEVSRRVAAPLDAAAKRHEATRSAIVVRRGVSGNS